MTAACVLVASAGVNSSFISMWKRSLVSSARCPPFTGGCRIWLELAELISRFYPDWGASVDGIFFGTLNNCRKNRKIIHCF